MQTLAACTTSNKLGDLKKFRKETTIHIIILQHIYVKQAHAVQNNKQASLL